MAFFDCTYDCSITANYFVFVKNIDDAMSLEDNVAKQISSVDKGVDAKVHLMNFEESGDDSYACYEIKYDNGLHITADREGDIDGLEDESDIEDKAVSDIEKAFAALGYECFENEITSTDIPSFERIHEDVQNSVSNYYERRRTGCLGYDD